jgi:endonuclease/exonuclease/phosphatase family metal-dependent hydrolase
MSENETADGNKTKGRDSRAGSEKSVRDNIKGIVRTLESVAPDIMLFQEVDKDAGRSYGVDEAKLIGEGVVEKYVALAEAYAKNFHTGWLLYPPVNPIGRISDSGLMTLSRFDIASAERRSLPVDEGFPQKYFDLDRCFSALRMPVAESESELVFINVHLSSYARGAIRTEQMKALTNFMTEEKEKGNWVIAGGDFNQAIGDSADAFTGRMKKPDWVNPFDEGALPDGFSVVISGNADVIATSRDTSIPWIAGVSYETIFDAFIVSDNISAMSENIDAGYSASDHNPVLLTFTLKGQESAD